MIRFSTNKVSILTGLLLSSTLVLADDFSMKWDEAEAKRVEAAELGYEWRDTNKLLKSAKKESEAGNTEKAMTLVAQALEQSNDAIAQSQREKELWASRVPK